MEPLIALVGVTLTTSPGDALVPRTLMQLVFLAATVAVVAASVRGRRLGRHSAIAADSAPR